MLAVTNILSPSFRYFEGVDYHTNNGKACLACFSFTPAYKLCYTSHWLSPLNRITNILNELMMQGNVLARFRRQETRREMR